MSWEVGDRVLVKATLDEWVPGTVVGVRKRPWGVRYLVQREGPSIEDYPPRRVHPHPPTLPRGH